MNFIPFFKAICAEVVISTSDSGTHIRLSNKVAWVGSVYWLYERKCYLELEAIIRKENVKSVLLLGTPGNGKSLFMKWLMWRIVCTRGADTDITFRVSIRKGISYFCTTRNGGAVEVYDSVKHGKPDYYFSDSVDVTDVNLSNILTLLVSSDDDEEHFERFNKALSTHASILDSQVKVSHGLIVFMPLFSFEESVQLKKVEISASHLATCTSKYDVVGGSARNFVKTDIGRTDRKLKEFVSSLYEEFFPADAARGDVREWAISIIVDALVSVTDERHVNQVFQSLFRHRIVDNFYKAVEKNWASPFLAFVAGAIAEVRDGDGILNHLKSILIGPGEGYVFEYYHGHRFLRGLVHDEEPYPVIDLSTSKGTDIKVSVKRFLLLRTVEDIGKLQIGDCGIPTTTNFPLVDAVVKGATMGRNRVDLLINFTVGTKHDGSSGTLPMLTAMLGPASRSVELFILPEAILHSVKGSDHDIPSPVRYYKSQNSYQESAFSNLPFPRNNVSVQFKS